jgi:hypothetical protein
MTTEMSDEVAAWYGAGRHRNCTAFSWCEEEDLPCGCVAVFCTMDFSWFVIPRPGCTQHPPADPPIDPPTDGPMICREYGWVPCPPMYRLNPSLYQSAPQNRSNVDTVWYDASFAASTDPATDPATDRATDPATDPGNQCGRR